MSWDLVQDFYDCTSVLVLTCILTYAAEWQLKKVSCFSLLPVSFNLFVTSALFVLLLLLFKNVYMCSLLFNNCYIISTCIIFIFCSHFLSVTNCLHLLCQGFTLFTSGLCYTLRIPTFIYTFINLCPIFDLCHLSFFKSK